MASQSEVGSLALDQLFHRSPKLLAACRSQFAMALRKASSLPTGTTRLLVVAVTMSALQASPCALAGSRSAPATRGAAHADRSPSNRAAWIIERVPIL